MTKAVFTQGSTLRHMLVMAGANCVGLIALFTVDLIDIYFLSLLGQQELTAAVGFAGALLFFLISLCIGLQIAMGVLVARAEGARKRSLAGRYCTNILLFSALSALCVTLPCWFYIQELLVFLGARGKTLEYAIAYSHILLPSIPLLALGMSSVAALRAIGDARRSAYTTMGGALINAALDPLFIFGFGWGIEGAAGASFVARVGLVVMGLGALIRIHRLPCRVHAMQFIADLKAILPTAGPAVLTNLATPLASTYVLKFMANYGDDAVAGATIIGRVVPVVFAFLFALSGAVGPIIGQNAGAGRYDRVRECIYNAMLASVVYVLCIWFVLYNMQNVLIGVFDAAGQAAFLIEFYCSWLVGGAFCLGFLFVANAAFNNLRRAYFATLLNFSRTLLGVIPLVSLFSHWFGVAGVLAGEVVGGAIFGCLAIVIVLKYVSKLEKKQGTVPQRSALTKSE